MNSEGTYSELNVGESLTLEKIIEAGALIPKIIPEENLLGIIITTLAPETELGKCQLEHGFWLLIRKSVWLSKVENILRSQSKRYEGEYATLYSSCYGTPVYEDDAMAAKIIVEVKEYWEKQSDIIKEKIKKYTYGMKANPYNYYCPTVS